MNNFNTHDEYSVNQIDKAISNTVHINSCIGKLDMLKLYVEQSYGQDMLLQSSISNILDEMILMSGNKGYNKAELKIKTKVTITPVSEDSSVVQSNPIINIKTETKSRAENAKTIENLIPQNSNTITYKFENSSMLGSMEYNYALKKLTMTFKNNGRTYAYLEMSRYTVEKLIILDEEKLNPGSYFRKEVILTWDKNLVREITNDEEMVG